MPWEIAPRAGGDLSLRSGRNDGRQEGLPEVWQEELSLQGVLTVPMKSQRQRRWMHANEPEMAKRFEAKTPKNAKLPERVKKGKGK